MIEPTQTCHLCGNSVVVVPEARGFPPDIARGKLRRLCQSQGCTCDPHYTAGISPELLAQMRATEEFHALISRLNAIREELDEVRTERDDLARQARDLYEERALLVRSRATLSDERDEARATVERYRKALEGNRIEVVDKAVAAFHADTARSGYPFYPLSAGHVRAILAAALTAAEEEAK